MEILICNMRLTSEKPYWTNQLQRFADSISREDIIEVQFGKQDMRGGFSITLIDNRHCVPRQRFFESKQAMLGFVEGWNSSKGGEL